MSHEIYLLPPLENSVPYSCQGLGRLRGFTGHGYCMTTKFSPAVGGEVLVSVFSGRAQDSTEPPSAILELTPLRAIETTWSLERKAVSTLA